MENVPFEMTDETAAWLERTLTESRKIPELLVLAPFLSISSKTREDGSKDSEYILGWNHIERIRKGSDLVELNIAGFTVYTYKIVLLCLQMRVLEMGVIRNVGNVTPNVIDEFFWKKKKRKEA